MDNSQTNTRAGALIFAAAENLTGLEARIVSLGASGVSLNADAADARPYVLTDGAAEGEDVTIQPLTPHSQVRIRLKGTCVAGDKLVLADPTTAADKGKVRVLPSAAGTYAIVGLAEEAGVDGQVVLVRPYLTGLAKTIV